MSRKFKVRGGTIGVIEDAIYVTTKLAGCTFWNEDKTARQDNLALCGKGTALTLQRERENKSDRNAIAVCIAGTGLQVGYVPAGIAARISWFFDHDAILNCNTYVEKITGGAHLSLGARIRIELVLRPRSEAVP